MIVDFEAKRKLEDEARHPLIVERFDEIKEWAEEHDEFNMDFVDSLEEQFLERGGLSDKQIKALDNILEKWVNR